MASGQTGNPEQSNNGVRQPRAGQPFAIGDSRYRTGNYSLPDGAEHRKARRVRQSELSLFMSLRQMGDRSERILTYPLELRHHDGLLNTRASPIPAN